MGKATDNRIVVANFVVPVSGHFRGIEMDFERNGRKTFRMQTYDITVVPEGTGTRVKITTWDRNVRDVARFRYRVYGNVYLLEP
jgi:hypothetical protein